MSNRLKKLQRHQQKFISKQKENNMVTRKAFIYKCEDCGKSFLMWLQKGLEEPGENHKPVQFIIQCKCGGMATHVDWNNDIKLNHDVLILDHMNYFAFKANRDCGIAVLR